MRTSAAIFGCLGPRLGAEEIAFFRDVRPWGFILFARNIEGPDQVRSLVNALRETVGREDAPVLIDQEGGRVQRFAPPPLAEVSAGQHPGAPARRHSSAPGGGPPGRPPHGG